MTSGRVHRWKRGLVLLALAFGLGLAACGGDDKGRTRATTTTETSTTTTTILGTFCDRAPTFSQSATDVLGAGLTQAKSDPAAYSRFRDDFRALDQTAHELSALAPDELKSDMGSIVTTFDQVQSILDPAPTPSDAVFQQIEPPLADPQLKASLEKVNAYVGTTCGGVTTTTSFGTTGTGAGTATTRRRSTATTARRLTTTTRPGATTIRPGGTTAPPSPTTATTAPPATSSTTGPPGTSSTVTTATTGVIPPITL